MITNIKKELKQVIIETMIPESEEYLEELHTQFEKSNLTDENRAIIRDMESFLVELQNIILAIEEDKITDEQAEEIYHKINTMIDEHHEH